MSTQAKQRSLFLDLIAFVCTVGLLPLFVLAFARITHQERSQLVVVFEVMTPVIFVPAYAVFAFAMLANRRLLGVVSAFLILCHVFWVFPELGSAKSLSAAAKRAPQLRVFSHNVEFDNFEPEKLAAAVKASNADLLVFQEYSYRDEYALEDSGVLQPYQYTYLKTENSPIGEAVYSKYPLSNMELLANVGFPGIRGDVTAFGKTIRLYDVHIQSPVQDSVKFWRQDLATLKGHIDAETGPTLVVGDFNSTFSHRPFRDLLNHGFTEAAMDLGRGYSRTWPMDRPPLAVSLRGIIRLDHVLTNKGLVPTHIEEGDAGGSDHRSIIANVAVL